MKMCKNCRYKGCALRGTDHVIHAADCENYTPASNADRIRSMSDEELAAFIVRCVEADFFRVNVLGTHSNSAEEWLDWLKEVTDG